MFAMTEIDEAQQQVLDEARKVNEQRLKAVEELAAAVAFRVEVERQLHEAKKEEKRLMNAAEKQGWTRAQVNKFARAPKAGKRASQSDGSSGASGSGAETQQEAQPTVTPTGSH